jgi:hypothetical protein
MELGQYIWSFQDGYVKVIHKLARVMDFQTLN